jgi:hypothetical protein
MLYCENHSTVNYGMKIFSGIVRLAGRPSSGGGLLYVLLVCTTAALAAGCSKKDESSAAAPLPPPQTNAASSAPAMPPAVANSQSGPAASATNAMPDLRPLNQALIAWIIQNRRHPATFEEFAASANIQIPPPPPGEKYVLNSRGLISLVNR